MFHTPKGRLCYPKLFTPDEFNGRFRFSCGILVPKAMPAKCAERFEALKDEIERLALDKFGDRLAALTKSGSIRRPIQSAEKCVNAKTGESRAGFTDDLWYISTSTPGQDSVEACGPAPEVRRWDMTPASQSEVFMGCNGHINVTVYAYDNVSKGVSLVTANVQILGGGERLGGGPVAEDAFEQETNEFDTAEPEKTPY